MPSKKILTPINSGSTYHIFNRGVNYEDVFKRTSDYTMFLEKLKYYIYPVSEIYAFALLPNHYHLLIRVKDDVEGKMFSHQFKRFILSYSNTINQRDKRSGNLFLSVFKRLEVDDEEYFRRLIFYIHYNPEKHKVADSFQDYQYSSYKAMLSDAPTLLNRMDVLEIFNDRENFEFFHTNMCDDVLIQHLIIE